jgi:hypothetical protein
MCFVSVTPLGNFSDEWLATDHLNVYQDNSITQKMEAVSPFGWSVSAYNHTHTQNPEHLSFNRHLPLKSANLYH